MVHKCNIVLTQFHKLQKMYQYAIKFEIKDSKHCDSQDVFWKQSKLVLFFP